MRILHVAAEAHPLIKTGGLADVSSALPAEQRALGADAMLLLPGYPAVLAGLAAAGPLVPVGIPIGPVFGAARVSLLKGHLPVTSQGAVPLPVIAIDAPWLFARQGNPYIDGNGHLWADNHLRFGLLGWVAARIASGELLPEWVPDTVHAHDWHAALAPVYLGLHPVLKTRSVFTIHNLAFQGRFSMATAAELGLPPSLLTPSGLEFHGDLSFMKGGLIAADRITTVSPTYAHEITLPEFGHGLDGLVRSRVDRLSGILNGVDTAQWDPSHDNALLAPYVHYGPDAMAGKAANRHALLAEFGLDDAGLTNAGEPSGADPVDVEAGNRSGTPRSLVLAVVSRLSEQKGLDLLLAAMPAILARGMKLVLLGSGDAPLEHGFRALAGAHPRQVAVSTAFDEALAHRIFSGADAIVVPSRFEPCGLTQMYGLRYGTVPIVRRVGGLADTVTDERDVAQRPDVSQQATGFMFDAASPDALIDAVMRAADAFTDVARWNQLMAAGMRRNVSWRAPAKDYLSLYESIS